MAPPAAPAARRKCRRVILLMEIGTCWLMSSPSLGCLTRAWFGGPADEQVPGRYTTPEAAARDCRADTQPMDTATQVVVLVTPSMTPTDSVTRLPIASRELPSTT